MQLFRHWSNWQSGAWTVGALLALPLIALCYTAFTGSSDAFTHIKETVLSDYVINTLLLVFGVCLLSCLIALPLAWLVASYHFPGRNVFSWALMLPLAMPSYLIAYIYTDTFDYAGPVQRTLRAWFDWQSPSDYWFFDMRTLGGAIVMLALVLYPYVYLIFKTALQEQSPKLKEAALLLGKSPLACFWSINLPLARAAIVAAVALVAMESMADFATVHYFSVNTLTTAVYDMWLGYYSLAGAAKIALVMLVLLFVFASIERVSRANKVSFERQQSVVSMQRAPLSGAASWLATSSCLLVLLLAFIFPTGVLLNYALNYWQQAWQDDFLLYAWQSFYLAFWVSVATVIASILINFAARQQTKRGASLVGNVASLGYALPGTVLAVAVLIPLMWLDDSANVVFDGTDVEWGLLLSGTLFALFFAYVVRFYAIAHGTVEASFKRISPSLDMASYSLGKSPGKTLFGVHLPIMKKGLLTAGLLVFIECMKELPAALLLRPFNFDTLATHVYQYVSDEQLELAAISALLIVIVGLIPLYIVNRSMESNLGKTSA